jgi:hypothetical protein
MEKIYGKNYGKIETEMNQIFTRKIKIAIQ